MPLPPRLPQRSSWRRPERRRHRSLCPRTLKEPPATRSPAANARWEEALRKRRRPPRSAPNLVRHRSKRPVLPLPLRDRGAAKAPSSPPLSALLPVPASSSSVPRQSLADRRLRHEHHRALSAAALPSSQPQPQSRPPRPFCAHARVPSRHGVRAKRALRPKAPRQVGRERPPKSSS